METKVGNYELIKNVVRQGCVLLQDMYFVFSEILMREIKDKLEIQVRGYNICNLCYAARGVDS